MVLDEPPPLKEAFKHYWYINERMLTGCVYRDETPEGNFTRIPKNSDAGRLMYYVLVKKNGRDSANNITDMTDDLFDESYKDGNDKTKSYWRFPERVFTEVQDLLKQKLNSVKNHSYNCTEISMTVAPFNVFERDFATKGEVGIAITFSIDLHLPLARSGPVDTPEPPTHSRSRASGRASDFTAER